MRTPLLVLALALFLSPLARADVLAPSSETTVDIQTPYTQYRLLPGPTIGSGYFSISHHDYDVVLEFNLTGPVTGLTLGGELDGLRHISVGGDYSNPVYSGEGVPSDFSLQIGVVPTPPALTAQGLGSIIGSSLTPAGSAFVDNGVPSSPFTTAVGPDFSVSLNPAAVAAANAAFAAGTPFFLVIGGRGGAPGDASVEGDLSGLSLTVQSPDIQVSGTPVPEPSSALLLVLGIALPAYCVRPRRRCGSAAGKV